MVVTKFFNQSVSATASLLNKAMASARCWIAYRIPVFTPPENPVFFGRQIKCTSGKFDLIRLTDWSIEPLSTTTTSALKVCFCRELKHSAIRSAPFQFGITTNIFTTYAPRLPKSGKARLCKTLLALSTFFCCTAREQYHLYSSLRCSLRKYTMHIIA